MKEKAPAFQFYPRDFLTDEHVRLMSHTERGIYITLLCVCWCEGSLPTQPAALARLAGFSAARFARLWSGQLSACFYERDSRLYHKRLDKERRIQAAYRRKQKENGKRGGRPRKNPEETQTKPVGFILETQTKAKKSSSSSSAICYLPSAKEEKRPRPIFTGQKFDLFQWQVDALERIVSEAQVWAQALDRQIAERGQIAPVGEKFWPWLLSQAEAEAKRRGAVVAGTRSGPEPWSLDVCRRRGHGGIHGGQWKCDQQVELDEARKAQAQA